MVSAPEKLSDEHDISTFDCGEDTLNDWLRRHALKNQAEGASRTFVICEQGKVIGFYCLAMGAVTREQSTGRLSRGMPSPVPMALLGRLAIDINHQEQGLGRGLLRDAILRTVQASENFGVRGMFVHALSPEAKRFYENCGFQESPAEPNLLMIPLKDAKAILQ
ncbi:MAG: GNAT family N-acetyltransferase [Alphaproteobacteria bacterium]|nr:GNAT family N-acetyltransferase [Alphaproteobacteria bacterium]